MIYLTTFLAVFFFLLLVAVSYAWYKSDKTNYQRLKKIFEEPDYFPTDPKGEIVMPDHLKEIVKEKGRDLKPDDLIT